MNYFTAWRVCVATVVLLPFRKKIHVLVEVLDLVASWRNGSASGFDRRWLQVRALRWSSTLLLIREEKTVRHSKYSAATTVKEIRNGERAVGFGPGGGGLQWI